MTLIFVRFDIITNTTNTNDCKVFKVYLSKYTVTTISANEVINNSTVNGINVTDALNNLQNTVDSKLNKPTTTSNTTSYPYVVGEDGNDNKKAMLRHTFLLKSNTYSIIKEVKFEGTDKWIKRNEYLLDSIKQGSKIIVHNYQMGINDGIVCDNPIGELVLLKEYVDTYLDERRFPVGSKGHQDYHNAHITLVKSVFDEFKYDESPEFFKCEDSIYTSNLVKNGLKICYISNKLSFYRH